MKKRKASTFVLPSEFLSHAVAPVEDNLCFVIMPFSADFDDIWHHVIKKSLESDLGLRVVRADDIYEPKPIMSSILEYLQKAGFVIADMTGRNANVFYELGIAHAIKNNVILLTQNIDDVPFDLRHLRCIEYTTTLGGAEDLRLSLKRTIDSIRKTVDLTKVPVTEANRNHVHPVAIEVNFSKTIEEGGAYIGDVEDRVSEKAHKECTQNLGRIRAALAPMFALEKLEAEGCKLSFPGGYVLTTSDRKWGSGFDISYEVITTIKLSPPRLDIIDAVADRLGPYEEIAYELSHDLAIQDIYNENRAWQDQVDFLDDDRITYKVDEVYLQLKTESGTSRISLRHRYSRLRPKLHNEVSCQLMLAWLYGQETNVRFDAKAIAD